MLIYSLNSHVYCVISLSILQDYLMQEKKTQINVCYFNIQNPFQKKCKENYAKNLLMERSKDEEKEEDKKEHIIRW